MKKTLEQEINEFFNVWGFKEMSVFFESVIPIIDLFDPENEKEIENLVGKEDEINVKLIRTIYLMSKFAELHGSKMYVLNTKFKGLWKRLEKRENENEE